MGFISLLKNEGEKAFKEKCRHSAVAAYLAKAIEVLETINSTESNPTPAILAAGSLHKKLIHFTPALLWEVTSIILQIEKDLANINDLLDKFKS